MLAQHALCRQKMLRQKISEKLVHQAFHKGALVEIRLALLGNDLPGAMVSGRAAGAGWYVSIAKTTGGTKRQFRLIPLG